MFRLIRSKVRHLLNNSSDGAEKRNAPCEILIPVGSSPSSVDSVMTAGESQSLGETYERRPVNNPVLWMAPPIMAQARHVLKAEFRDHCPWNNQRLDGLVKVLRESKTFQASDGISLFYRVTSGREALRNMVGPRETESTSASDETTDETTDETSPPVPAKQPHPGMPLAEAIQRLTGTLVGKDGH